MDLMPRNLAISQVVTMGGVVTGEKCSTQFETLLLTILQPMRWYLRPHGSVG
jgi:hypothetical protein